MITEIQNIVQFLQQHFRSNFTKFHLYVSSIWRFVQNVTGVPSFVCEFYHRDDRALGTTFTEISGSQQKKIRRTWNTAH